VPRRRGAVSIVGRRSVRVQRRACTAQRPSSRPIALRPSAAVTSPAPRRTTATPAATDRPTDRPTDESLV